MLYLDREQSRLKHEILRKYLQRFAIIVGRHWSGIIYVDGFSGPWNSLSPHFADSSFAIALEQLREARRVVAESFQGKPLSIDCVFLEKNRAAFTQLEAYAKEQKDINVVALHTDFEDAIPELVSRVKMRAGKHFPFILIDPKGWKGFGMDVIRPLIQLTPCEVLVNFMTGHLKRFIEDGREGVKESFRKLFGDDSYERRIEGLSGRDREDAIVEAYADRLAEVGGYPFVATTLVLQPKRDRTHFHLVYATRNLKGIEVFKDAERKALELAEVIRGDAKRRARENASGQGEMFGGSDVPETYHLAELQMHFEGKAARALETIASLQDRVEYDTLYAAALKFPTVQEKFLRAWVSTQGRVINLGTKNKPQIRWGHIVEFRTQSKP